MTQLNLVHAEEIAYDEFGTYGGHLNRLTDPADGVMDAVHTLRDQHGADMVALLVDDGEFCGIAWLMQNLLPSFEQYAFSVTTWFCAAGNLTFPHELGHNMGCQHDRDNAGSSPVFAYSYGYQDPDELFRTVMAYNCPGGCPRIQHLSNPGVLYLGQPTGIPTNEPDSAHNALTINQTAFTVANFRCSVLGACCLGDGSCIDSVSQDECEVQIGGAYQGIGTNCSPNPCLPPPTGACCFADGTCTADTLSGCNILGGSYQGDGTSCSPNPCPPPPTGACCLAGDFCAVVSLFSCTSSGGTYQGDGASCSPNPCVPPTGACCLTGGSCLVISLNDCNLVSGIYQGDGSNCSPNNCPAPSPRGHLRCSQCAGWVRRCVRPGEAAGRVVLRRRRQPLRRLLLNTRP